MNFNGEGPSSGDATSPRICQNCGRPFWRRGARDDVWNLYCGKVCKKEACRGSPFQKKVSKVCEICGTSFEFVSSGQKNNDKRRFCSGHCAAKYRNQLPGRAERFEAWIGPHRGSNPQTRPNPRNSESMKRIWADPAYRARVLPKYQGKTFLSRGGNGKLTVPQMRLSEALQLPMEYPILTKPVTGLFPSLPPCYKVDLADPKRKLAIEVDGNSHRSKRWMFLDRRKTEILNALGWTVIRFKNEDVLANLEHVVMQVRSVLASLPLADGKEA